MHKVEGKSCQNGLLLSTFSFLLPLRNGIISTWRKVHTAGFVTNALIIEPTLELREANVASGAVFHVEERHRMRLQRFDKERFAAHLFRTGSIQALGTAIAVSLANLVIYGFSRLFGCIVKIVRGRLCFVCQVLFDLAGQLLSSLDLFQCERKVLRA
jgi:hypothetical protein